MKHLLFLLSFLSLTLSASSQSFLSRLLTPKSSIHADTIGELPPQVEGTSSLFFLDGQYWTCNDHGQLTLYALDTATAAIVDSITLAPYIYDMEEVSQDDDYLYFGDMGDNNGVRNDLHILRLSKSAIPSGPFLFDTIFFSYPERNEENARDFDCEAFVVTDSTIILFTKQWNSHKTVCYAIPNSPGIWLADSLFSLPVEGMVTGASYIPRHQRLVLCGYNSFCSPFVFLAYGFECNSFNLGQYQRIPLSNGIGCQTEAIATLDGLHYFLTCEKFDRMGVVNPSQLLYLDLTSQFNMSVTDISLDADRVVVYPNPTSTRLHLPSAQIKRFALVDMQGRKLLEGTDDEWINLYDVPSATYLLHLTLKSDATKTITIIKR